MNKVAVIDYGMGNLHSVAKAIEYTGARLGERTEVVITSDAQHISRSDRVIFPGVGAIRDCMAEIRRLRIDRIIKQAISEKPVLAICVGMQALMLQSEENDGVKCLGLIKGRVKHFGDPLLDPHGKILKVPHMGWNQVRQTKSHPLWQDIPDKSRFYFVHSYYIEAENLDQVAGVTNYSLDVVACLSEENIFAVQFHPEKSQEMGQTLLRNFLTWDGSQ
jgi:glutamine amidotransferase